MITEHCLSGRCRNNWMKTGDTCRRRSNNGCGGGPQCQPGYTGNNNNNGGNTGGNPGRGHPAAPDAGSNDGYNRNPQGWNDGI